jgi:phosphoenolpyruvate-protein kinase (PTS system EI component)
MSTSTAARWSGTDVSPGSAVGVSWRVDRPVPAGTTVTTDAVVAAFAAVAADLERLADRARADGRPVEAEIVEVGALIAADPALVEAAVAGGVQEAVESYARTIEELPDETLADRAADVRQVGRRVLARLNGAGSGRPDGRFVLVAAEIGAADLLDNLDGLAGAVAVRGGANSHAAIIARSVGRPFVTGVDPAVLDLPDGTPLLVDGATVVVHPAPAELAAINAATARAAERRAALAAERGRPSVTADGHPFTLLCNVASDVEVRTGREAGAAGIGLLRTELPFLHDGRWPAEADHRRALRPILAAATGWPVTLRLLDFSGDKVPSYVDGSGLAALLGHPAALAAQLRAALDLGRETDLRIMAPMVSTPDELATVRAAVDAVARDLGVAPVPVGAMVETLAAVEAVEELCAVADFLSIGTNDLTAVVLGLDRRDPRARPELAADPRIMTLVRQVAAAGARTGTPVSVCGDAAGHPATVPLLLAAGIRIFSVAAARVDETRVLLRS